MKYKIMLAILTLAPLHAAFVNRGVMSMQQSNISADVLVNDGTLEGIERVNCTCYKLEGSGIIKGKIIRLAAKDMSGYTGTIECEGDCEIASDTKPEDCKFINKITGRLSFISFPSN